MDPDATVALHKVRVLDLSRVIAGPFCTLQLADLGAEIIKVEHPDRGDDSRGLKPPEAGGEAHSFLALNRNKKSIALDIQRPQGREILEELAAGSDVLVENFRPGVMKRLGMDYDTVRQKWPRLIYCSISAYGQSGPMADRPGFDPVVQAESGMMSLNGEADGPPLRHPISLNDFFTGLYAALAVVAAVHARERTGRGQYLDLTLMDSAIAALSVQAQYAIISGQNPPRMGNSVPPAAPVDLFSTPTGPFYMAVGNDRQFDILCRTVLGRPELAENPRFTRNSARLANREALMAILKAAFSHESRDVWLARLRAAGVPAGAVRTVSEALASEEVLARRMVVEVEHPTAGRLKVPGSPLKLTDTPPPEPTAAPLLGQHTTYVLRNILGKADGEVQALRNAGVIAVR